MGACVPALVIMSVTPLLVLWLYPPKIRKTPEAPAHARRTLNQMGSLTYGEATTLAVLVFAVTFWVAGSYIKALPLSTAAVAIMALALLLITGVMTWEDCLACTFAWGELCCWHGVLNRWHAYYG
jgi:DASS family divalent anion:Na+ symporter